MKFEIYHLNYISLGKEFKDMLRRNYDDFGNHKAFTKCKRLLTKITVIAIIVVIFIASMPTFTYATINQEAPEAPIQASPTNANILVDGEPTSFQAYNIGGNNFFMLRDLAYTLSGTSAQFDIGWDGFANSILITRGTTYTIVGGEMIINPNIQATTTTPTTSNIILAGVGQISPRGYLIESNNFFMLRDLGELLGFGVDWDEDTSTILIITTLPIPDNNDGDYDFGSSNAGSSNDSNSRNDRLNTLIAEIHICENGLLHPTNEQLLLWIELAPTMPETRSTITLPVRRPTDSEIHSWSIEYEALGGINAFELEVIRLVNEIRVGYGLNPLAICVKLSMAARFHSQDMKNNNFFAHTSPNTGRGTDRALMFGHDNIQEGFYGVGENISGGTGTPQQRVDGWMNSPGHRAAILRAHSLSVGVGATERENRIPGVRHGATTIKFGS